MNKKLILGILSIFTKILFFGIIAVCLFAIGVTISAKKDADQTATFFGYQMRTVISPSMEKSEFTDTSDYDIKHLRVRTLVFIQVVPEDDAEAKEWYSDLEVGDILTFKYVYTRQEVITHRIIKIEDKIVDGEHVGYMIHLQGDNKSSEEGALVQIIDTSNTQSPNFVIGKVTGKSYVLGLLISLLKNKFGLLCVIILPALALIILEVIRIYRVLNHDKKMMEKHKRAEQEKELEELRRKVALLEQSKAENNEG